MGLGGIHGSSRTNDEGQYTIIHKSSFSANYPPKDYSMYLYIEATGYETKWITDDDENHAQPTEEWQTIDIQLEPESGELR